MGGQSNLRHMTLVPPCRGSVKHALLHLQSEHHRWGVCLLRVVSIKRVSLEYQRPLESPTAGIHPSQLIEIQLAVTVVVRTALM